MGNISQYSYGKIAPQYSVLVQSVGCHLQHQMCHSRICHSPQQRLHPSGIRISRMQSCVHLLTPDFCRHRRNQRRIQTGRPQYFINQSRRRRLPVRPRHPDYKHLPRGIPIPSYHHHRHQVVINIFHPLPPPLHLHPPILPNSPHQQVFSATPVLNFTNSLKTTLIPFSFFHHLSGVYSPPGLTGELTLYNTWSSDMYFIINAQERRWANQAVTKIIFKYFIPILSNKFRLLRTLSATVILSGSTIISFSGTPRSTAYPRKT